MIWWGLMVGNSRRHWAKFEGDRPVAMVHTSHGETPNDLIDLKMFASVVPSEAGVVSAQFPDAQLLTLADIPLLGLYPNLGIDRALAVQGSLQLYPSSPCLVIDGGTALTFSAVDGDRWWQGGAILPGLKLQFASLAQGTAALPTLTGPNGLPERWANNTETAITSGITYTLLAGIGDFIRAWRAQYTNGKILITGGDGPWLAQYFPEAILTPNLIFLGMGVLGTGHSG